MSTSISTLVATCQRAFAFPVKALDGNINESSVEGRKEGGVRIVSNIVKCRWDNLPLDCKPVAHKAINVDVSTDTEATLETRGRWFGFTTDLASGDREPALGDANRNTAVFPYSNVIQLAQF